MERSSHITLHEPALNIVRRCGPALGDVLYSKFRCVATFDGVDFERDPSIAKPNVVQEKRFAFDLNAGVKVSVWKADLTKFEVDAVVNAANGQLQHCGGLARALSEAGGPRIQQESSEYVRRHGDLKTGEAIIGTAGSLPCKKIIHAVGPKLSKPGNDVSKAEPQLKKAIHSILNLVKENHFKTVAIPAISSGLFNYPLDQCAKTILSAVQSYYQRFSPGGHVPDEIMLVNHDEPTVREMERACHQLLATTVSTSYSQATASSRTHSAKTSTLKVQLGNVLVMLMKGNIEEQQTDVIVNTISTNRDLQSGAVSKALAKKAGSTMQSVLKSATQNRYVIATKGYELHCKEVFHTCLAERKEDTLESLYESVLDCLRTAVAKFYRSISFPAIGTGGHFLKKKEVAHKMSKAVAEFSRENQKELNVYFVIFPSDNDTYEAFETQLKCLQQQAPHASFTHASDYKKDVHDIKPPTPQINLISCSMEAIHEAERWLTGLLYNLSGPVQIYNNFIQHFGRQEYKHLSGLAQHGVSIQESFVKGHASLTVKGRTHEAVVVAVLQVEAMLCIIQKNFVTKEEDAMFQMTAEKMSYERESFDHNTKPVVSNVILDFKQKGLQVLKMENVKNPALQRMFELKKKQLNCSTPQIMLQRIPAQFCEMVCGTGFHAEYAPPEELSLGEGIYFARKVDVALKLWKEQNEEYLYFVEAEVLKGKSTRGKPGLILPPAIETDPQTLYDSVNGGDDVTVIFSSYQALPKHIITCKMMASKSYVSSAL